MDLHFTFGAIEPAVPYMHHAWL